MKIEDLPDWRPGEYYKCAKCLGHFKASSTRDEVVDEAVENNFQDMELVVVCDNCYKELMEWHENSGD